MKADKRLLSIQKLLHQQYAEGVISEGAVRDIDGLVKEAVRQESSWDIVWKPLLQGAGITTAVAAITVMVISTVGSS